MSIKKRKSYRQEFKVKVVRLIAEASRDPDIENGVMRYRKNQFLELLDSALPGKIKLMTPDEELLKLPLFRGNY